MDERNPTLSNRSADSPTKTCSGPSAVTRKRGRVSGAGVGTSAEHVDPMLDGMPRGLGKRDAHHSVGSARPSA